MKVVGLNKDIWSGEERLWEGRQPIVQICKRFTNGKSTEFVHCGPRSRMSIKEQQ